MPIDFALDIYGDLDFGTGDLSFVEDGDEVAQLLKTKTLKLYDEDRYAPRTGIKWFGTDSMYDHQSSDDYRKLQLRSEYLSIPEVKGVPVLTIDRAKNQGDPVEIVFLVNHIYGTAETINR